MDFFLFKNTKMGTKKLSLATMPGSLSRAEMKNVMGGNEEVDDRVGFGCPGIIPCHEDANVGDSCYGGPGYENCKCKGTKGDLSCS